MTKLLDGRVAFVTGPNSSIGQATAIALAREGADVAVSWLRDEESTKPHTGPLEGGP